MRDSRDYKKGRDEPRTHAENPYGCVPEKFRAEHRFLFDYLGSRITREQIKRIYGTDQGEKI